MSYLVIAYPDIEQSDHDWIQRYRKKNDPRYFNVVNPHITLVFAMNALGKEAFIAEVTKQVKDIKPFTVVFKVATINQDDSGEYFHEFLVPDTGNSDVILLHDKLYSDLFASSLRFDIDFIPHIGIGNSEEVHTSKARVDALNADGVAIAGKISELDVVEHANGTITTIHKISL